jgi:hypothetical protein
MSGRFLPREWLGPRELLRDDRSRRASRSIFPAGIDGHIGVGSKFFKPEPEPLFRRLFCQRIQNGLLDVVELLIRLGFP